MRLSGHYWVCYSDHWTIGRFDAEIENAGCKGWWLLPGFAGLFDDHWFSVIVETPLGIPEIVKRAEASARQSSSRRTSETKNSTN